MQSISKRITCTIQCKKIRQIFFPLFWIKMADGKQAFDSYWPLKVDLFFRSKKPLWNLSTVNHIKDYLLTYYKIALNTYCTSLLSQWSRADNKPNTVKCKIKLRSAKMKIALSYFNYFVEAAVSTYVLPWATFKGPWSSKSHPPVWFKPWNKRIRYCWCTILPFFHLTCL